MKRNKTLSVLENVAFVNLEGRLLGRNRCWCPYFLEWWVIMTLVWASFHKVLLKGIGLVVADKASKQWWIRKKEFENFYSKDVK
jgi:hypothetical protein